MKPFKSPLRLPRLPFSPGTFSAVFALSVFVLTLVHACSSRDQRVGENVARVENPLAIDLGGPIYSSPAVTRWGNRLDVWVRDGASRKAHRYCSAGCELETNWTAWESGAGAPSGGMNGDPTAVAWGIGPIDLFVRSGSNIAHQTWVDGTGWLGWEDSSRMKGA